MKLSSNLHMDDNNTPSLSLFFLYLHVVVVVVVVVGCLNSSLHDPCPRRLDK